MTTHMKLTRPVKRIMRAIVPVFLLMVMLSTHAIEPTPPKINVLTTFKPVSLIVKAIAGDRVALTQLIPNNASPHFYSLKPSSIRKIKQADLIFRVSDDMEIMLDPVFDRLKTQSKLITLAQQPNIHFLTVSADHQHPHSHSLPHNHEQKSDHKHSQYDPHIWTSPDNAIAMAEAVSLVLSKADPKYATDYQKNLTLFKEQIHAVTTKIKAQLKPVKDKPYLVFHPSWQYFSNYFGLQKPMVISLQESITPGVKSILKARKEITEKGITCIFSSPEISQQRINTLKENTQALNMTIDVLGRDLILNENGYAKWLEQMGEQVNSCLQ